MDILEKLKIIDSDLVPKEDAKIEVLSTSLKITHTCGCVLVRHFAYGTPHTQRDRAENPQKWDMIQANRMYHIELCALHSK